MSTTNVTKRQSSLTITKPLTAINLYKKKEKTFYQHDAISVDNQSGNADEQKRDSKRNELTAQRDEEEEMLKGVSQSSHESEQDNAQQEKALSQKSEDYIYKIYYKDEEIQNTLVAQQEDTFEEILR